MVVVVVMAVMEGAWLGLRREGGGRQAPGHNRTIVVLHTAPS